MTLLGIPQEEPAGSVAWVVLKQPSHEGRTMVVSMGAPLRSDCRQLAVVLEREAALPEIAATLRRETKCSTAAAVN